MKRALQPGRDFERAHDRRHCLDVAFVCERASDAQDRLLLAFGRRPGSHVEPVGDCAHRSADEWKIGPETSERVLADEREAGERPNLKAGGGGPGRAPGRGLIGVALEHDARARRRGDQGRGGKMIFDHREIDSPPAQELGDAERLADISADGRVGNGRDLDALERLVDQRTGDQRRTRVSAI